MCSGFQVYNKCICHKPPFSCCCQDVLYISSLCFLVYSVYCVQRVLCTMYSVYCVLCTACTVPKSCCAHNLGEAHSNQLGHNFPVIFLEFLSCHQHGHMTLENSSD